VSLLVVLGAVVAACGSAGANPWASQTATPADQAATAVGKAAPPFAGVTLDGKTVALDQYRGKPLLLVYMTGT